MSRARAFDVIEAQFDLRIQEARAAEKARELEDLADEIKKGALEAEQAAIEPVPEVPGQVEQEPELPMIGSEAAQDQERP